MSLQIPSTQLRLQPYITISAAIYQAGTNPTTAKLIPVMAVQKVTMTNSRPVHLWRELNTDNYKGDAAQPIKETYPGLPTYELELDRVVLYGPSGTIVEALGFSGDNNGADLIYQSSPLVISFQLYDPPSSTTSGGSSTTDTNNSTNYTTYLFWGCWLQDNPFTFDITQEDLKIVQTVKITAAGVTQTKTATS